MNGVFSIPPATLAHYAKKRAEGEDQPVSLDALHVHEMHPGVHREAGSVHESAPLVHESGADQVGTVEQLQKFDRQRLDRLDAALLDCPQVVPVHMPVTHRFVPGLYSREIFMPGPRPGLSGTILTSKEHATEHLYIVLSGAAEVAIPGEPPVVLTAGYVGITRPGTRRALRILEDCRWITFHVLSPEEEERRAAGASVEELLDMIQTRIIAKNERADGRDIHREYTERLRSLGLPGPNDGEQRTLEAGE